MSSLATKLRSVGGAIQYSAEQEIPVEFGSWMPDQPSLGNPGGYVARNVIPGSRKGTYEPFRNLSSISTNALESEALGGTVARDSDNNIFPYAGTATKLYELRANAWTDESKAGGYSTNVEDVWEFTVWDRSQLIIATNFNDPVQSLQIGEGASADFADLITSTNKPTAKHIDAVRDFMVLGHTNDTTDGVRPNRVWWSAIGDPTDFDPDATTLSDYSDLPAGGWVQRIVGGAEYGVIFQEKLIRRMEFIGSPVIFDLPAADRKRGTPIPNSVIAFGRNIFYISEEGFFVFNGSSSEPIGNNRVDNEFWRIFDLANKTKVSTAIDLQNKLVLWAFPAASSVANTIFVYKWDRGDWSEIRDIEVDRLLNGQNQGFTLEQLDSVSTNIDTLSPSLDSNVWKGGKAFLGAIDTSHVLASFDGPTLQATMQTGERQFTAGRNTVIRSVRPLIEVDENRAGGGGGTGSPTFDVSCVLEGRNVLSADPVISNVVTVDALGEANFDQEDRYHRITVNIPADTDWAHANGVIVYKHARGRYHGNSVA